MAEFNERKYKRVEEIQDEEYQEYPIEKVKEYDDGYEISHNNGWLLNIDKMGFIPEEGDTIRTYGRGIGYTVRGVAINGWVVRYLTARETEEKWEQEREVQRKERREKAESERYRNNQRVAALPPILRDRIYHFRDENPDFWWDGEPYELFVYEQATLIAIVLGTVEAIEEWEKLDYNEQKRTVPIDDGHSGYTFGSAVAFAKNLITGDYLSETTEQDNS